MATEATINKIRDHVGAITRDSIDVLVSNPTLWGPMNFEVSRTDLKLIFSLCEYLRNLPIEIVPESTATAILTALDATSAALDRMRKFVIEGVANPTQQRDEINTQIRTSSEQLLVATQGWIAFLAYQKGDVQRNIQALNDAVTTAKNMISEATIDSEKKKETLEGIISAAREASASVGVAHFTHDFSGKADTLEGEAKLWLIATAVSVFLTVAVSVGFFFVPFQDTSSNFLIVQYLSSKLVLLGVLLTATVWCGRIYKATKHQAAMNSHRANALKSFQAFVKATDDEPTRNAVLLETTRSIFAIAPTGYLDGSDSGADSTTKIMEIVKGSTSTSR